MKSNTHKTIHLLAQSKEGSSIVPMQSYILTASDIHPAHVGKSVNAVRPHPDGSDLWQVETGQGLIWVKEFQLQAEGKQA